MKIATIIPAHNEEKSLGPIVRVAKRNNLIDEVIVVDDGSVDLTSKIAQDNGAKLIRLEKNQGKGKALEIGVKGTKADLLLFLDADLINLNKEHLTMLLKPVIEGKADMTVGAIDRKMFGNFLNEWFRKTESPFSGMRAIKRSFWDRIPENYKRKFYIESAITYFAKRDKINVQPFVLEEVRHIIKEKKLGFWKGTLARWNMNYQIVVVNLVLRLKRGS